MTAYTSRLTQRYPFLTLGLCHSLPLLLVSIPVMCVFVLQVHYFLERIPRTQIRPEIMSALTYSFWMLLGLSFFYFLYALARRLKKIQPSRWKVFQAIFSIVVQFLLRLFLLLLAFILSFSLFELQFVGKALSPDQSKMAYLYTYGIFCGYSVFLGDPYGIFTQESEHAMNKCTSYPPEQLRFFLKLAWTSDSSKVEVIESQ